MCLKATGLQILVDFMINSLKIPVTLKPFPCFFCLCNPVFSFVEPHWRGHLNITTALKGGKHPARTETQA